MTINTRIDKMIDTYNLEVSEGEKITACMSQLRKNASDYDFLRENTAAFLLRIPELEAERKASRDDYMIRFYWAGREIAIDTRGDVEAQLRNAQRREASFSILHEDLREVYDRHTAKLAEAEAAKARADAAENARVERIKQTAVKTGKKKIINKFTDNCSDPAESDYCKTDLIVVWAMPDGSTLEMRQHTWNG